MSLQEILFQPALAEETTLLGNAAVGEEIFRQNPAASCIRCHQLEGEGGIVGPSLDGIAARKQPDYLRQSLLEPQAVLAAGYPAEVSPMPPFGVLLTPQEIEHLMAFLLSLKTIPEPGTVKPPPQPISFE